MATGKIYIHSRDQSKHNYILLWTYNIIASMTLIDYYQKCHQDTDPKGSNNHRVKIRDNTTDLYLASKIQQNETEDRGGSRWRNATPLINCYTRTGGLLSPNRSSRVQEKKWKQRRRDHQDAVSPILSMPLWMLWDKPSMADPCSCSVGICLG
jgi:hypothetical protein